MDDESQEDQESHGAEQEDVAAQRRVLGRREMDLDQEKKIQEAAGNEGWGTLIKTTQSTFP